MQYALHFIYIFYIITEKLNSMPPRTPPLTEHLVYYIIQKAFTEVGNFLVFVELCQLWPKASQVLHNLQNFTLQISNTFRHVYRLDPNKDQDDVANIASEDD